MIEFSKPSRTARGWNEGTHQHLRKKIERPRHCGYCQGQFVRKSRGRIFGRKFCSQACQRKASTERAAARAAKRVKQCPQCGVGFSPKWSGRAWQKYCSPRCLFARHRERAMVLCAECGAAVSKMKADARRRRTYYCSVACRTKHFRGEHHPMFRADSILDPDRRGSRGAWKQRAREIRERDAYTCRRCGVEQAETERDFPVDHIIPWRVFEDKHAADDASNLATLCHSCHTWKTSTAERQWLAGDVIAFEQFKKAISL